MTNQPLPGKCPFHQTQAKYVVSFHSVPLLVVVPSQLPSLEGVDLIFMFGLNRRTEHVPIFSYIISCGNHPGAYVGIQKRGANLES